MYRSHTWVLSYCTAAPGAASRAILAIPLFAAALLLSACAQPGGKTLATADGNPAKFVAHGVMAAAKPAPEEPAIAAVTAVPTEKPAKVVAHGVMGAAKPALEPAIAAVIAVPTEKPAKVVAHGVMNTAEAAPEAAVATIEAVPVVPAKKPGKFVAHGVMKAAEPTSAATMTAIATVPEVPAKKPGKFVAHGVMGAVKPASEPTIAAVPAKTAAAPATIWQSADKLLGLAAEELQAALGAPARIRDEERGRIYQYIGSDCVLDLFLYQEEAGAYRVSYAEARSSHADKKPVDACLKSLPAPVVADNAQPSS